MLDFVGVEQEQAARAERGHSLASAQQ